jgi:ketosteroid isomerase-like protein
VSENLDLVRSIFADWQRGDFSRSDWADPDIEFAIADGPAPGSWVGRREMARAWRDVLGAWGNWQVEVEEFRELDSERVLVLVGASARGKTSGISIEAMRGSATGANLFQIRSGKVTRLVVYFLSDRALADLGLEE